MEKDVQGIIQRYGSEMILVKNGKEQTIRAFLQEGRSKSRENTQRAYGPLGERPRGLYVYMGPAEPAAEEGDELRFGRKILQLRRAEPMMYGDRVLYIWGLCEEKGSELDWGE